MTPGLRLRGAPSGDIVLPFLVEVSWEGGGTELVPAAGWQTEPDGTVVASGESGSFAGRLHLSAPAGTPARRDGRLVLRYTATKPTRAAFTVECRLGGSDDPNWLVPGLFYQANRWPDCTRLYPRFTTEHPDPSRLESSSWSFRADRAATPAVFAWDRCGGAALACAETGPLGENGIGFAVDDAGAPILRLHFPFREQPVSYDGSAHPRPPVFCTATLGPGQEIEILFALFELGPDHHEYADVLRRISGAGGGAAGGGAGGGAGVGGTGVGGTGDEAGGGPVAWVGIEEAAELAAWGLYRWHYRAAPPVLLETAAFDREALGEAGDRPAMHVSWVSGAPYAYALLRHARRRGQDHYLEAASAVLGHIAGNLTPGGTFWGQWLKGKGWSTGWTTEPGRLHSRTLADAALFILRAARHEQRYGARHLQWERAVRSNLDVVVRSQRPDGALGAAYAAGDGGVLDWRGSAGLAWVAPLAEAARAWSEPRLLSTAQRAGDYYAAFVEREYLCGAPEDVDLAPTSEDGYLAIMSYMALWRADGSRRWLELARRSADWMLTFRYTYDVSFSPRTLLGHYRFRTAGADQASPSNQHLHNFGLICLPEMAELSAALDDSYYHERQRETLACFRQFVAREDGDFDAYKGMVSERYYQTDCFQAKGMLLTLSHAWCAGVLLLACEDAITSGQDWEEP